ncbi:receptor-like protein EIX2 [Rutidosis leptorrhynchoides]|uniref:receptor-like protein EIX2 n=1 Tax=Rutidosis leptorrhynchoides TaxID=125765 RepID=UPI003A9A152D
MCSNFSFPYSSCYYLCLLLLLFPLCFSNQNYDDDDVLCIDGEKQALLEFKYGLVDEANKLASWDDDASDCCRWAGVVCDNVTGHIQGLHLAGDGLDSWLGGILSPSIMHLKQLRHLDLSDNAFEGIIPPQLGNLSELNFLSLGTFFIEPTTTVNNMQWLSSLRQLHYLDMSGVDLSKANDWFQVINALPSLDRLHLAGSGVSIHPHAPSRNITSLSFLDLSNNNISSSMGQWIFSIHSLVSLELWQCSYLDDGTMPRSIDSYRNLTYLQYLNVGSSYIGGSSLVLEGIFKNVGSNLISLDISYCGITSSNLDSLHNLTSIRSLDLSNNQLSKTIPKSFGNFCNLRKINLSYNNFSDATLTSLFQSFLDCKSPLLESFSMFNSDVYGHLPNQLEQLKRLRHLTLYDNNIGGIIPDSIGRLSSLRSLDLSGNRISGPIPYSMGRLSSLEMLDLSSNHLNGNLPHSLGQLTKLDNLDFSSNLLTGVVTEAHFAKLENLKFLEGSGNNLTLRTRLANLILPFQIEYLYLRSWVLGPEFLSWLQTQTSLRQLDVSNTGISSPMPHSFLTSFPNLNFLDMSKNHLRGELTLLNMTAELFSLDLSSNEFRGKLPKLPNISVPTILDLSNNFFEGSLHQFLCSKGTKGAEHLFLESNNLSGFIPDCWDKWPILYSINLENNNLSGKIPRTLGLLGQLEALNMNGNKLSGTLHSVMNLTSLGILQLGRNELVGTIPLGLRKFSNLRLLNLRSNNLDGNVSRKLCNLTSIQILDLANNRLSGDIPRCFNKFSVLTGEAHMEGTFTITTLGASHMSKNVSITESLVMKGREDTYSTILGFVMLFDLSNNNFSGNIPNELTSLIKLESLNLSRNQLTGRIPEKIGDMKALETFDLSLNKLSGELPMSLSTMNFLISFNVSYNNLRGKVPSGTQIQSFDESSFIGNNLWGGPLSDPCVPVDTDQQDDDDGSHGVDWGFIVSLISGFIVGFWMLLAPLIVSKAWRIAYFGFLIKLWYMVYDAMYEYCFNMFLK